MIINDNITVKDDRLINGLVPTISIMSQIEYSTDKDVVIDFSNTRFISPVFALSMLVYVSNNDRNIRFANMNDYMKAIHLDNVIKPDEGRRSEFVAIMERYSQKTYIPVISFPAQKNNDDKEDILSVVENLIIRQLSIQSNVASGVKYLISETIDNIT